MEKYHTIFDTLFEVTVTSTFTEKALSISPFNTDCCSIGESDASPDSVSKKRRFHQEFKIVPRKNMSQCTVYKENGLWSSPAEFDLTDSELRLIGFFDWDEWGLRSFEFIRVMTLSDIKQNKVKISKHTEMLMRYEDCLVFFVEPKKRST